MRTRILASFIAATLLVSSAWALVSQHGREQIGSSGWSEGLTAIVNHPARVCGQIGPLGPISRFHYSGDAATLNTILEQYAALTEKPHVLYLHPEEAPYVEGFNKTETHDFDVSINVSGQGAIHLYTLGRIKLEELKIPENVAVETTPLLAVPQDSTLLARARAEQKRVEAFVAGRKPR